MSPEASHAPARRIVTLDAVRGFALFGIILVHMVEQYLGSPPPASRAEAMSTVDGIVTGLVGLLFVGKFFAMFSLLFGISFFIQMDRAAARGKAFGGRFAWRLAVLFAMGMAHHALYRGDILAIYAALGLTLLVFYRVRDRWLLAAAGLVLAGAPRLLLAVWTAATGTGPSFSAGEEATLQAYWDTLKAGSPAAIAWLNLTEGIWPKLEFQFSWFGRGYQTLGLFLVGLYIGRHGWHLGLESRRAAIGRLTRWSAGTALVTIALIGAVLAGAAAAGALPDPSQSPPGSAPATPPLWLLVLGFTLYDVFNLAMMGAFAGGFVLLLLRGGRWRALRWLAPVGQTALTSYLAQSIAGGLIFYGVGLNLLGEVGPLAGLGLAVVVFAGQIVAAHAWLRHFRFGPVEWLWRSATYFEIQPLVRKPAPVALEPV